MIPISSQAVPVKGRGILRAIRKRLISCAVYLAVLVVGAVIVWSQMSQEQRIYWRKKAGYYGIVVLRNFMDFEEVDAATIRSLDVPSFKLVLSDNDLAHFYDLYYQLEKGDIEAYAAGNKWRKAKLIYEGVRYKIKVRVHGATPVQHRDGRYFSMRVKLPRGKLIMNARTFNFIIRKRVSKRSLTNDYIAKAFDVVSQDSSQLISVKINDWEESLFFFEYRTDKAYYERIGHPQWFQAEKGDIQSFVLSSVFKGEDRHKNYSLYKSLLPELVSENFVQTPVQKAVLTRYLDFNTAIINNNHEAILDFIDIDYTARFEAARLLGGYNGHGIQANNIIMPYDPSTGWFYPVFHRDFWCYNNLADIDPKELEKCNFEVSTYILPPLLSRNEQLRQRKYQYLWQFVSNKQRVTDARNALWNINYYDYYWRYPFVLKRLRELLGKKGDAIKGAQLQFSFFAPANAAVIKEYLETATPTATITKSHNNVLLEIHPESMSALILQRITALPATNQGEDISYQMKCAMTDSEGVIVSCSGFEQSITPEEIVFSMENNQNNQLTASMPLQFSSLYFCDGLSAETRRFSRSYYLLLEATGEKNIAIESVRLHFYNYITGTPLTVTVQPKKMIIEKLLPQVQAVQVLKDETPLAKWLRKHDHFPFFLRDRLTLSLPAEAYDVRENIILPDGYSLYLAAGTTLKMGGGVSIFGSGELRIDGTQDKRVIIERIDPAQPFGVIGFRASKRKSTARLSYTNLSGGGEATWNGIYFSGALALHNFDQTTLDNVEVSRCVSEDGLNIKGGWVELRSCRFIDNAADQVDLDKCKGNIHNSTFYIDQATDANGDGLDISLSRVKIYNNSFIGFSDKGISIGEKSFVFLHDNLMSNNVVGVAVKDESICITMNNKYKDNQTDISVYIKKAGVWNAPELRFINSGDLSFSDLKIDSADSNMVRVYSKLPAKTMAAFADFVGQPTFGSQSNNKDEEYDLD